MSRLGYAMRAARVESFQTIGDVADKSGAHPGLIGKLERGYIPTRCGWFRDFERALSLPRGYLVELHQQDLRDGIKQYDIAYLRKGRQARLSQPAEAPSKRKTPKARLGRVA